MNVRRLRLHFHPRAMVNYGGGGGVGVDVEANIGRVNQGIEGERGARRPPVTHAAEQTVPFLSLATAPCARSIPSTLHCIQQAHFAPKFCR